MAREYTFTKIEDIREVLTHFANTDKVLGDIGHLRLIPFSGTPEEPRSPFMDAVSINSAFGITNTQETEEAVNFCMAEDGAMNVMAEVPMGNSYGYVPVSRVAYTTIADRAGFEGPVTRECPTLFNYGLEYREGTKFTALVRDGVLIAAWSKGYAPLSQIEGFENLITAMNDQFGHVEFTGGAYSDYVTFATITLPDLASTALASYNAKVKAAGKTVANIIPAVRWTTSDTTNAGMNLYPMLYTDSGLEIRLDDSIRLRHSGSSSMSDFVDNCYKVMKSLTDTTKKLGELLDIRIKNPEECFAKAVTKRKLPKRYAKVIFEDFVNTLGAIVTAHDIYWSLWNIRALAEVDGANPSELMRLEESLAQLLVEDWEELDSPLTVL